jgi:hypothetical protein
VSDVYPFIRSRSTGQQYFLHCIAPRVSNSAHQSPPLPFIRTVCIVFTPLCFRLLCWRAQRLMVERTVFTAAFSHLTTIYCALISFDAKWHSQMIVLSYIKLPTIQRELGISLHILLLLLLPHYNPGWVLPFSTSLFHSFLFPVNSFQFFTLRSSTLMMGQTVSPETLVFNF